MPGWVWLVLAVTVAVGAIVVIAAMISRDNDNYPGGR